MKDERREKRPPHSGPEAATVPAGDAPAQFHATPATPVEAAAPVSLTDRLALDRTELANERTLLAYARTALGLVALGVTSLHFLTEPLYQAVGYVSIVAGGTVLAGGLVRFAQVRRRLRSAVRAVDGDGP